MVEKLTQMGYQFPSSLPSLKVSVAGEMDRSGPDSGIFISPGSSFNMTQRSVSDADFSASTLRSGRAARSSDKIGSRLGQEEPGSISGRSDDTDITMENCPGLFDQMDSPRLKKPLGHHDQPHRSRSPSPYHSQEKISKQHHEPVQMSSISQPGRTGSMGLHRNVASPSLQPFSEMVNHILYLTLKKVLHDMSCYKPDLKRLACTFYSKLLIEFLILLLN